MFFKCSGLIETVFKEVRWRGQTGKKKTKINAVAATNEKIYNRELEFTTQFSVI